MTVDSLWRVLLRNLVWIVILELISQGFSFLVGYEISLPIGYIVAIFRTIVVPILFSKMVFGSIDHQMSIHWKIGAFVMCWLPLIVLDPIDMWLYNHVSGYYQATMQPGMPGAGETHAVEGLAIMLSWIATTISVTVSFLQYNRGFNNKVSRSSGS